VQCCAVIPLFRSVQARSDRLVTKAVCSVHSVITTYDGAKQICPACALPVLTACLAVVLLRGCWLDGTNKCLKNGAAEVCTCSTDLCNGASRTSPLQALGPLAACLLLHRTVVGPGLGL
jgi:hypothetical protein